MTMTTAKENAKTAHGVIKQSGEDFSQEHEFQFVVYADNGPALDRLMDFLTGSFAFNCENISYRGVLCYRLFLPRTDVEMEALGY